MDRVVLSGIHSLAKQKHNTTVDVLPTTNLKYTERTFDLQGNYNANLYHESRIVFITNFVF